MRFRLRYLQHDLELTEGQFAVGRNASCQLSLDDPLVSRRHAILYVSRAGACRWRGGVGGGGGAGAAGGRGAAAVRARGGRAAGGAPRGGGAAGGGRRACSGRGGRPRRGRGPGGGAPRADAAVFTRV